MLRITSNENSQGKKGPTILFAVFFLKAQKGNTLLFLCGLSFYKVFNLSSSSRKEKQSLFSFGKSSLSPFFLQRRKK